MGNVEELETLAIKNENKFNKKQKFLKKEVFQRKVKTHFNFKTSRNKLL